MLQPSETGEQILSEVKLEPGWLVQEMKSASAEVADWPEWKRRSYDAWWERLKASQ
jgi:hypothetical protein